MDFVPVWRQFTAEHDDKVNVGMVDCDSPTGKPLCNKLHVNQFPTLYFFPIKSDLPEDE